MLVAATAAKPSWELTCVTDFGSRWSLASNPNTSSDAPWSWTRPAMQTDVANTWKRQGDYKRSSELIHSLNEMRTAESCALMTASY